MPLPLRIEHDFGIDLDELQGTRHRSHQADHPQFAANPTGGVLSADDLRAIADIARERDLLVLADEIYSRILYEGSFASITVLDGMPERTVILDGFSKTYAMTGWRLGYGVMPEWLAQHVTRLNVNSNSCTATFVQIGGLAALTGPQEPAAQMVEAFRGRRDVIVDGLNRIPGFRCLKPHGAFYAFPSIRGTGMASKEMEQYLLNDAGVATLAGTSFGAYGEGFLRLSYANSIENINQALERIDVAIRKRGVG